jgi:drug/metabolite transporter (DMT)-like permease
VLGYAFLGTTLTQNFIIGILLLSFGTLLVSHLRFKWQTALLSIHAGIFFALHYITFKGLLEVTSFDNAFFWSRVGFVAVALSLLLVPDYLEKIRSQVKSTSSRGGVLVLLNKVLAGISSILILKAVELGDPAVVQALGGLQFVFILIIGMMLGSRIPRDCGENCNTWSEILHKVAFVTVISVGFFVLFIE